MLSFEMSQGYLKHGKLKADDGTTLAINGKHDLFFEIFLDCCQVIGQNVLLCSVNTLHEACYSDYFNES